MWFVRLSTSKYTNISSANQKASWKNKMCVTSFPKGFCSYVIQRWAPWLNPGAHQNKRPVQSHERGGLGPLPSEPCRAVFDVEDQTQERGQKVKYLAACRWEFSTCTDSLIVDLESDMKSKTALIQFQTLPRWEFHTTSNMHVAKKIRRRDSFFVRYLSKKWDFHLFLNISNKSLSCFFHGIPHFGISVSKIIAIINTHSKMSHGLKRYPRTVSHPNVCLLKHLASNLDSGSEI